MPRRAQTRPVVVPIPVLGIDQRSTFGEPIPGTCNTDRNVRSLAPYADRIGIGKRHGTRRTFVDQCINTTPNPDATRVFGLSVISAALDTPAAPSPNQSLVADANVSNDTNWSYGGTGSPSGFSNALAFSASEPDDDVSICIVGCHPSLVQELTVGLANPVGSPSPVRVVIRFRINMFFDPPPHGGGPSVITLTAAASQSIDVAGSPANPTDNAGQIRMRLLETSTVRATSDYVTPTSVGQWETFQYELSSAEIAAIGNYNNLRAQFQVSPGVRGFHVTWCECQIVEDVPAITQTATRVLATIDDKAYIGNVAANTLTATSNTPGPGTDLSRMLPSIAPWHLDDKWYVVDGLESKVVDASAATCDDWAASVGSLPVACHLACVWRNRMVLAKQTSNPSIWYMSRVGSATDWDFVGDADEPPPTLAVAGTNRHTLAPQDVLTALIPAFDDILLFGGEKTIYAMRGDPGFGGKVDILSNATGVLGPRAWCIDEFGTIWFVGTGGLYRIPRGTLAVEPVSGGRMFKFLDRIDADEYLVQLVYDAAKKEVVIFRTRTANDAAGLHVIYDIVRDAFHLDQFLDESPILGPWSVCQFTGADYHDRRWLMGTDHGYILRPDDSATGDDVTRADTDRTTGFRIRTIVDFAAIEPVPGYETTATKLRAWGMGDSQDGPSLNPADPSDEFLPRGPVAWRWYADVDAATVQQKAVNLSDAHGSWFDDDGGLQTAALMRVTGGAHRLRLEENSKDKSWAIARVQTEIEPAGEVH